MKHAFSIFCPVFAGVLALSCSSSGRLTLLVGTYTENTASDGVYLYSFDSASGRSSLLGEAASGNPSFVIPAPGGMAYGVNEFGDGRQGVSAYVLQGDSVSLAGSVRLPEGGEDPCNILFTGSAIVTSNYTGGSLGAFAIEDGGTIGNLTQSWTPSLPGKAHMHCAVLSPDGRYIFATNLGNDCVHRFELKPGAAPLGDELIAWSNPDAVKFGPRHMVFSADGRFAYLLCELADKLVCFSYDDGVLRPIQTLDAYGGGGHGSADIHLSPDGRFLYTSHRLKEDGIAFFKVDGATGLVSPAGYQPTGVHPRNFAITPDGRFLLCACRDSGRIEVYSVNRRTGFLSHTGHDIVVPAPVCIMFVDKK